LRGEALRLDGGASTVPSGGRAPYGAPMAGTWWLVRCHQRWAALVPLVLIVALGATGTLGRRGRRRPHIQCL
jgi:hypothetical protein